MLTSEKLAAKVGLAGFFYFEILKFTVIDKFVDCESAATLYHQELRRILDTHAPLLEFNVSPGQSKWMNTACQAARTKRRKTERDHKRLNTELTKKAYKEAYQHAAELINATRNGYYKNRLETNAGNKKVTYKIVNQLMDRELSKNIRPNHKPDSIICEEMKTYFKEKVEKIYSDIENEAMDCKDIPTKELTPDYKGEKWEKFELINEETLRSVLSELNTKECEADPIPVKLLLQCIDEVKTILMFIINQSLSFHLLQNQQLSGLLLRIVNQIVTTTKIIDQSVIYHFFLKSLKNVPRSSLLIT